MGWKTSKVDDTIEIVGKPHSKEMKDIQLAEDQNEDSTTQITRQNNHEAETLESESDHENIAKKQAEDKELDWAQYQYPTPDPSILEACLANSVNMPVLQMVEPVHETETTLTIELAILDKLYNQLKHRFYDIRQYKAPSKLPTALSNHPDRYHGPHELKKLFIHILRHSPNLYLQCVISFPVNQKVWTSGSHPHKYRQPRRAKRSVQSCSSSPAMVELLVRHHLCSESTSDGIRNSPSTS